MSKELRENIKRSCGSEEGHAMERILASRKRLMPAGLRTEGKVAEEGGCGVVGFAANVPVRGRHIFEPSIQMHNRGNGKGGGIAAASLVPEQIGLDARTLKEDYLLQIALLDADVEAEVERDFVAPFFRIDHKTKVEPAGEFREFGLETKPPDIVRYAVRVKKDELERFSKEHGLGSISARGIEDEFVYQNSFRLNQRFYASLGEKRAFVLSHARDLMIFKIVGYAEQVVQYYGLTDFKARVWIAHQRYPTKGRVWHPAGSHPFIGMNEALVHNGDFANYHSVSEYLRQHSIAPQFLTDTEVSVLLFDLWHRIYGYPVEYVIEALAPTTELDFERLPEDKKEIYRAIQALHMHGSPDGPWFFIIARSEPDHDQTQLMGITDTSMLRPQVFALQEGDVSIGLVASEKQAIDATLHSLHEEDPRFRLVADRYWNARGGSHTDGGAFLFSVRRNNGATTLSCTDKFGRTIASPQGNWRVVYNEVASLSTEMGDRVRELESALDEAGVERIFDRLQPELRSCSFEQLLCFLKRLSKAARLGDSAFFCSLTLLTLLNDRRYDCGDKKRSMVLQLVREEIDALLDSQPVLSSSAPGRYRRITWQNRGEIKPPASPDQVLVVLARDFPPEGDECDARLLVRAYTLGWRKFIVYALRGQRFTGCGFGPNTQDVRIDVYGSSGDYLGSGIDGMEIRVHGNAQDQLGQIVKQGRLVIYGDVGQTFMYGAKGAEVYVMGNAAGRPLINAVGRPRVVINGTSLDFLAESFMAGDPYQGGGFVVLNGIEFDDQGKVRPQATPYPGGNLFSLASGGALFVRDPHRKIVPEQLNGGEFADFTDEDWRLIKPYLDNNERFFAISVEKDLLCVDGVKKLPSEVYRKARAVSLAVLAKALVPE
ncbi:MAG: glutamate synthase [Deltaproteobacteria bacterium]|nr:glutamate synthase [Deltaproteobacteria bacterium]